MIGSTFVYENISEFNVENENYFVALLMTSPHYLLVLIPAAVMNVKEAGMISRLSDEIGHYMLVTSVFIFLLLVVAPGLLF